MEHNRELHGWLPLREKMRANRDELLEDPERIVAWEGVLALHYVITCSCC